MALTFKKAVKREAKGRVALMGPAGSGKSYTMLKLARRLAGPGGKVAAVDTEHGSLSKYADVFDFDVIELDSYSTKNFLDALHTAENEGYNVFCVDSLSHFWVGKDGALEFVDNALKVAKSRSSSGRADDMAGWKEFTPHEREMVDAMIASPCHVIVTMRVKTAYEEQVNERTGRKQRVKVGLAPVQRAGLEYEFDLVGAMDEDNTLIIDKCRVVYPDGSSPYAGKAFTKPGNKEFEPFVEWLKGAPRERQQNTDNPTHSNGAGNGQGTATVAPPSGETGSRQTPGTQASEIPTSPARANTKPNLDQQIPPELQALWAKMGDRKGVETVISECLDALCNRFGEDEGYAGYNRALQMHGVEAWQKLGTLNKAKAFVRDLWLFASKVPDPPAAFQASDDDVPPIIGGEEKAA